MELFELIAPCHFGLEAVLKKEILDLGYEISKVEDGKVTFLADYRGIVDANIGLRTTERILLKVGEITGARLASIHNLRYLLRLMEEIRDAIAHDRFLDFRREFYERYDMTRNF